MHYLNTLLALITHHPGLAYGAVFLVSLSESLALVGLLVPGTVIMFGVGAVVATGSLGLAPVLLLAMAGAIAGDGVSYWLGHHYKERLMEIWLLSRYPGMLRNGEAFFHRHGGKGVLFGRFVGPVRPVIPVVAGMLGMSAVHFGVVNVLSAILVIVIAGGWHVTQRHEKDLAFYAPATTCGLCCYRPGRQMVGAIFPPGGLTWRTSLSSPLPSSGPGHPMSWLDF